MRVAWVGGSTFLSDRGPSSPVFYRLSSSGHCSSLACVQGLAGEDTRVRLLIGLRGVCSGAAAARLQSANPVMAREPGARV